MSKNLQQVLDFTNFLLDFQAIERIVSVPNRQYGENDAEHSYSLAMMAWYLAQDDPELNIDLVIRYSLIHDLVEVYAGDTFAFSNNPSELASKKQRELAALVEIKKRYPDFEDMTKLIDDYETLKDPESRFVYALDKLMPVLIINLEGGRLWHKHKISRAKLIKNKRSKISGQSPVIEALFDQVEQHLATQPGLFPS
jgi:putative hydrolases of HD superfamily